VKRAEKKEERRAALLEGALAVLTEHGLEGFTTGRVAAAAGIAQSGFYKYWPDRDAALGSVAQHVGERVLRAIRDARLAAAGDPGKLPGSFAGALRAMVGQPRTTEIFLRFRREPGPLGDVFRALIQRGLDELHTDMVAMGLVGADDPRGARMAFYVVAVSLGTVEALLDGRIGDVDIAADELGRIAALTLMSA